jgi:C4-dicarboxylate-specific signal transduction histidine kinase
MVDINQTQIYDCNMENIDEILFDAPTPIAWLDMKMNFINANKKFLELLNLKPATKLKGKTFADYFLDFEILSQMDRFIKSEDSKLELQQNILIDRKILHYNFIVKKIFTPTMVIAIYAEDKTALVESTQQLENLQASTISSSRMAVLGEMASGIAHEINNPLSVIAGLTDHLIRTLEIDSIPKIEMAPKLFKIKQTTERICKIVKGLKSQARDGSLDPFQSNTVRDLVNDSLALCVDTLKFHEINLIIEDIDPAIELECRGTQISQVILNLVSNAKDAIKDQNAKRWIKVGARDIGNFIEFSLTDSGSGISPDIRQKILQPFFTTKPVGEGTGLGLSITKNIIDSHSGILQIAEDAANTTFIFSIPKRLSTLLPIEV